MFLCCFVAGAQNDDLVQVAGYVVEKNTGEALPYAHVVNEQKNIGKVANIDGFFTTIGSPGDTLTFSMVGFQTVHYVIGTNERQVTIEMEVDVQQLPQTTVGPYPKNLLLLKEDMRKREVSTMESVLEKNMEKAGFNPVYNPIPQPPGIMNPISFIYEKVFKKLQEQKAKTRRIEELPELKDLDPRD